MAKEKLFDNARFTFVGTLSHGQEPMSTKRMGESEWFKTKLGVGVRDGANSPYLDMEHIHKEATPKEIKLMTNEFDSDNKRKWITVPYDQSSSDEVLAKIPDFLKVTIDLETDFDKKAEYTKLIFKKRNHEMENNKLIKKSTTEVLTDEEKAKIEANNKSIEEYSKQIKDLATNRKELIMKDAIELINKALPILKDKKVRVTGQPKCNFYKGKNQLQYIPTMIELVPNDTPNQLKLWIDIFFSKDGVEDSIKERKMYINGYVGEVNKDKEDKLYPLTLVLDYTKVNDEVEIEKALCDYQKSMFETKNKKVYYKNNVEVNVIDGAEQVEFNESCLTEAQKSQIKFGLATLDSFKPKGNVYGDRVQELKFFKATLKNDFKDGAIEIFAVNDLFNYLVQDDSDVKEEDVKVEDNKPKEEKVEENSNNTDALMAKLFS